MEKKWYQSYTIWFNLVLLALDVINQLSQIIPLPVGFLTTVGILGNLLLRIKTSSGIALK